MTSTPLALVHFSVSLGDPVVMAGVLLVV